MFNDLVKNCKKPFKKLKICSLYDFGDVAMLPQTFQGLFAMTMAFADVVNIPASWFQGTHTRAPLAAIYAVRRPCLRPGCPHYRRVNARCVITTAGYCCSRCYFNKGHGENCTGRPEGCIFVDQPSLGSRNATMKCLEKRDEKGPAFTCIFIRTKREEKECNNERPRDSARRRKSRSPAAWAKRAARGNGKKRRRARSSNTSSQNMFSRNERGRSGNCKRASDAERGREDTCKKKDMVKGMGAYVVAASTAAAADSRKGTPRRRETSLDELETSLDLCWKE